MSDCKELQALGEIRSEVDESFVKITLGNQCIKAQKFLVDRLTKDYKIKKDHCKRASSENLKIEAEIKHGELELKSMMTALETLRSANVELKKQVLLAKRDKIATIQRVENGEKKYETLWNQCKKRYESIPFVQKWLAASNKTQELRSEIQLLDQETVKVNSEIKRKTSMIQELEKQQIIAIAKYILKERPKILTTINEKKVLSANFAKELTEKLEEQESHKTKIKSPQKSTGSIMLVDGDWPSLRETFINDGKDELMSPRHQFAKDDLNSFRTYLDQLKKIYPAKSEEAMIQKENNVSEPTNNQNISGDRKDSNFDKLYLNENSAEKDGENFKKRKLIHIIEDISIAENDAMVMVATSNPYEMQPVDAIGDLAKKRSDISSEDENNMGIAKSSLGTQEVLLPPTPFSDLPKTQTNLQKTKDETIPESKTSFQKKRVSFELPIIREEEEDNVAPYDDTDDLATSKTSQLNVSTASNGSYNKLKEMMLKKHNLDLSPDFVYTKNNMRLEDKIVTSKFFNNINCSANDNGPHNVIPTQDIEDIKEMDINDEGNDIEEVAENTDAIEEVVDSSAKNENNAQYQDNPVSGFLFTHGPNGIPESLGMSLNTTGFDDADGDYPHCIDQSLLLSPKADNIMPGTNDDALYSQEVPNFLSGLRKTGFSFFGGPSAPEANPEQGAVNQGGNFNFNFGGDDKKTRGIFSMFN